MYALKLFKELLCLYYPFILFKNSKRLYVSLVCGRKPVTFAEVTPPFKAHDYCIKPQTTFLTKLYFPMPNNLLIPNLIINLPKQIVPCNPPRWPYDGRAMGEQMGRDRVGRGGGAKGGAWEAGGPAFLTLDNRILKVYLIRWLIEW